MKLWLQGLLGGIGGGLVAIGAYVVVRDARIADLPAWVQAIGSIGAIIAAIWISRREARRQVERDARDLIEKRRAAFVAMETVIEQLATRDRVFSGEVGGTAGVLSDINTSILPPNGMVALVKLRNRVALAEAGAEHDARQMPGQRVKLNFDANAARRDLELARADMSMI